MARYERPFDLLAPALAAWIGYRSSMGGPEPAADVARGDRAEI